MNRPTGSPRGLTLIQFAKLIFACAVACACVTPLFRLVESSDAKLGEVLFGIAVIVPLVWALLGFVLVRRGPRRSAMILSLLLGVVLVALGVVLGIIAQLLSVVFLVTLGELLLISYDQIGHAIRHIWVMVSPIQYTVLALAIVGIPSLFRMGLFLADRLRALVPTSRPDHDDPAAQPKALL